MIEKENIEGYINLESSIPKKKGLLSFLWLMMIICIPSAILGEYASITRIIMLPLVIIMGLWIIYLLINVDTKKSQYILFLGIFSTFISISLLVAAYKIAAIEMAIPMSYVLLTLVAYMIINFISILNILRLIKKGYFQVQREVKNPMGIIVAASLFGLVIGKLLIGKINQDIVVAILVIGLTILGFLFSIGTRQFVKYYFIKKILNNHN